MRLLRLYAWPGNIRQLRNLMERLVVTVKDSLIQPEHLPGRDPGEQRRCAHDGRRFGFIVEGH